MQGLYTLLVFLVCHSDDNEQTKIIMTIIVKLKNIT